VTFQVTQLAFQLEAAGLAPRAAAPACLVAELARPVARPRDSLERLQAPRRLAAEAVVAQASAAAVEKTQLALLR
jgi:hypothetical protein